MDQMDKMGHTTEDLKKLTEKLGDNTDELGRKTDEIKAMEAMLLRDGRQGDPWSHTNCGKVVGE